MDQQQAGPGPSSEAMARTDGRTSTHMRRLTCERGPLSRADGSARWVQGGTSVLAAVYGPMATQARKEDPERAVVDVTFKQADRVVGTEQEREYEHVVRKTVEGVLQAALHPRTMVSIILQVVSDDGSLLACALNAACTALVDAAIPLSGTFAAASVALSSDGRLLIDPVKVEEEAAQATGCFAYNAHVAVPGSKRPDVASGVLTCVSLGLMTPEDHLRMIDLTRQACQKVASFSRLTLEKAFEKKA